MYELTAQFRSLGEEQAKTIIEKLKWGAEMSSVWHEKSENKNQPDRTFRVVASTEDTDRSGEIIKADGRDYENFMTNPVILANHTYTIENIVGKATNIQVSDGQLVIEWVFSKSNPLAVLLADLYDEGMIKTVSVGFIPKQRQEDNRRIITSAELLELSFVAVPCNPHALSLDQKELMQKGIEAGVIQLDDQAPAPQAVTVSDLKAFEHKILHEVTEVKTLVQSLLDGKSKSIEDANLVAKETLQHIARATNEGLAMFKNALKG